jgi:hypothetical protein
MVIVTPANKRESGVIIIFTVAFLYEKANDTNSL